MYYDDTPINFAKGRDVMVNATDMAKPFGKVPKDWLRTQQSKDFINSLAAVRQMCPTDLLKMKQGGNDRTAQGTWMHEDVALEFARWLSPEFAIWCNDRIKELLTMGMTATPPTLEQMINDPELVIGLATKLKKQREENENLISKIEADAPRVLFSKAVGSVPASCPNSPRYSSRTVWRLGRTGCSSGCAPTATCARKGRRGTSQRRSRWRWGCSRLSRRR